MPKMVPHRPFRGRPCGRRCRARRPSACRSCRRCRGRRAGRSRATRHAVGLPARFALRRRRPRASRGRGRRRGRASACGRCRMRQAAGLRRGEVDGARRAAACRARPSPPSMPQDADRITFGSRIVDAGRKLLRREAAEHDRVHRADAGAGEHREDRLRDHRHVEDDAVALLRRRGPAARRRASRPRPAAQR